VACEDDCVAIKAWVRPTGFAIAGWRGDLEIEGDVLHVRGDQQELEIDCAQVKRYSFNASNGIRALRMKDGRKLHLQTPVGTAPGPDGVDHGRAIIRSISERLRSYGARGFVVGTKKGLTR
jgi:hypothetical protein